MDISSILGSANNSTQKSSRPENGVQNAIGRLLGLKKTSTTDTIATLSLAARLQTNATGLQQTSDQVARASSAVQTAHDGVKHIQASLKKLQALATQAKDPALTDAQRQQLNTQFQAAVKTIDETVNKTTFDGQRLLNGEVSKDKAITLANLLSANPSSSNHSQAVALSIDNLSSKIIFAGQTLDLSSVENADQALAAIGKALTSVGKTEHTVATFEKTLDVISANVFSALNNQLAATSFLQEDDLIGNTGQFSLANLQHNAQIAVRAQGSNLSPTLLSLIG